MKRYDQDVPFFANPSSTHCYQAALKMVLHKFRPHDDHSWPLLERVTGKVDGFGTWPFAGLTWLHGRGLSVVNVELMDNRRFAAEGRAYLAELSGPEFAAAADPGLDLSRVQREAGVFVETVLCEIRIPTLDDVRSAVSAACLVICNVNSRVLNGRPGYSGHFVVVKGFDDHCLIVHDPGPPGEANRRVAFEDFQKAWAYPSAAIKNLVAIGERASPRTDSTQQGLDQRQ